MNIHHVDIFKTTTQGLGAAKSAKADQQPTLLSQVFVQTANVAAELSGLLLLSREAPESRLDFVIVRFHQQFPDIFTGL